MRQLKISSSITRRDEHSVESYFQEIQKFPTLSADEEFDTARLARTTDNPVLKKRLLDKLVNANLRFVVSVAKQYQTAGVLLMDLIQEGNIGLITASQKFDETKGFKFISYSVWWIRQSILTYLSECKTIRLPQNKVQLQNKVYKATSTYLATNGIEPSADYLAQLLGEKVDVIEGILEDARTQNVASINSAVGDDDATVEDFLASADTADSELDKESVNEGVRQVVGLLNAREQFVLDHTFGLGGKSILSRSEIAEALDLTAERVRQIHSNAITKMRNKYGDKLKDLLSK